MDRAASWPEFLAGVSLVHSAAQNFLYADRDGHIGYTSSGAMPVRPRSDGRLPVAGTGEDDWQGTVPFDDLPRALDPPRGFLVTANNRATPRDPYAFGLSWAPPYRAARITELLLAKPKLSRDDLRSIQQDVVSLQAREVWGLLAETRPSDAPSRAALELLKGWNGEMAEGSAAAALYAAWYVELAQDAGGRARRTARQRAAGTAPRRHPRALPARVTACGFEVVRRRPDTPFSRRAPTSGRRRCRAPSLRCARGSERIPSRWRWESLHRLRVAHDVFGGMPVLRRAFDLEAGRGGDGATVNVGSFSQDGEFRMSDGASYRQVIDLSPGGAAGFALPGGQSGNVFDRRYRDLFPLWERGELFGMGEGDVEVLTLEPGR